MEEAGKPPRRVELLPYESLYPSEQAQKAVELVQDEISSHRKELERLRQFAADNVGLVNLVRRLPDELSHDIMVPFGKAAFFPGRLIHTNEFLVLLGEGYYADQTAKQTIGVLKRRGHVLESKMESLNSMIEDLEARARFFGETAGASGEGMVEIREYEESQVEGKIDSDTVKISVTDEEYEQILANLDEYEKAEFAADSLLSEDEEASPNHCKLQNSSGDPHRKTILEQHMQSSEKPSKDEPKSRMDHLSNKNLLQQAFSESLSLDDSKSDLKQMSYPTLIDRKSSDDYKIGPQGTSMAKPSLDRSQKLAIDKDKHQENVPMDPASKSTAYGFQGTAFTGSIVEHRDQVDPSIGKSAGGGISKDATINSSKPVSRFKMQRGR